MEALAKIAQERSSGELADHRARIRGEIGEGSSVRERLLVVATVAEAVVGFGRVRWIQPEADPSANPAPPGYYLGGVIVTPEHRRQGIGAELTRARLDWIRARAPKAWYFASALNRASIDLHARFGFREVTRDFSGPGVSFTGGVGILFRCEL